MKKGCSVVCERAVITGMGCISPIGKNLKDCSRNMAEIISKNNLRQYTSDYFGQYPVGVIPDRYFDEMLDEREKMKYDRISLLVSCVAGHCIESAGLTKNAAELAETGIISGSGFGCMGSTNDFIKTLYTQGPALLDPMKFPLTSHNYPVSISAIRYGLKGPVTSIIASIGSSMNALLFANYLLLKGQAKRIIVLGFDEITPIVYALLANMGYLPNGNGAGERSVEAINGQRATVPFEGCSGVVLEKMGAAKERGAHIYGEIAGWNAGFGSSQNLDKRILKSVKQTVQMAGESVIDITLLNRSGIPGDDEAEASALAAARAEGYDFGSHWALKPYTGNYLGASGLTEMVLALKMIDNNITVPIYSDKTQSSENGNRALLINNFGLRGNIVSLFVNTRATGAA